MLVAAFDTDLLPDLPEPEDPPPRAPSPLSPIKPFRVLAKVRSARVLRSSPLAWAVDGSGTDPTGGRMRVNRSYVEQSGTKTS